MERKEYCPVCMKPVKSGAVYCTKCGGEVHPKTPDYQLPAGYMLQGRYYIGRAIGKGGFGITYLACDTRLDLPVAIKEYYPAALSYRSVVTSVSVGTEGEEAKESFTLGRESLVKEAKVMALFADCKGIVSVKDVFEENNTAYIVMEYLDGVDLQKWSQENEKLSFEEALKLLGPVMDVLGEIHGRGYIHRDISPHNIMRMKNGTVKLLDFGAAREYTGTHQSMSVVLKQRYAPLEQYSRHGKQGPATDVYALCATIYYLITKKQPISVMDRISGVELELPSSLGCEITPEPEAVLMKGLSIKSEERWQSVEAFRNAAVSIAKKNCKDRCIETDKVEKKAVNSQEKTVQIKAEPIRRDNTIKADDVEEKAVKAQEKTAYIKAEPVRKDSTSEAVKEDTLRAEENDRAKDRTDKKGSTGGKIVPVILGILVLGLLIFGLTRILGGSSDEDSDAAANKTESVAYDTSGEKEEETAGESGEAEGETLNIYCFSDEFRCNVVSFYPGYEQTGDMSGKIGNVKVEWHTDPNADSYYEQVRDQLRNDGDMDLFLIEDFYLQEFVNNEAVESIESLGISETELNEQYEYTLNMARDAEGELKGLSWQTCSGAMLYRKDIAENVFGTSDPKKVQSYVDNWDVYLETSENMLAAGCKMNASSDDLFRVFADNRSSAWVEDGKLQIDDSMMQWAEMSKNMADFGTISNCDIWSEEWYEGLYETGGVFAYFAPQWFVDQCLDDENEESVAYNEDWVLTEGPQGFQWGGTWILTSGKTDNRGTIKDLLLAMTTDEEIMHNVSVISDSQANNRNVEAGLETSIMRMRPSLGGQNPESVYAANAEKLEMKEMSPYDTRCEELFMQDMKAYIYGQSTLDEALAAFGEDVKNEFPEVEV